MKTKKEFKIRNISIMFLDEEKILLADKLENKVDAEYLDVIFENYCPDCPPDENEQYSIGVCKVLNVETPAYMDVYRFAEGNDMLTSLIIDLKLKYGEIDPDDKLVIYTIKNSLIK